MTGEALGAGLREPPPSWSKRMLFSQRKELGDQLDATSDPVKVLQDIRELGYQNPGFGYSCAKLADSFLKSQDQLEDG